MAAERAAAAVLSCDTKGSPGGARGGFWGLQVIGYIMGTPIPSKFRHPEMCLLTLETFLSSFFSIFKRDPNPERNPP